MLLWAQIAAGRGAICAGGRLPASGFGEFCAAGRQSVREAACRPPDEGFWAGQQSGPEAALGARRAGRLFFYGND